MLVMMDPGTRELMLKALPRREAVLVAKALFNRVYLRGMAPSVFQSDNAKEFVADVMKELMELLGAKFRHSSPYHPQTNTDVERYNKTLATHLSLLIEDVEGQSDWDEHLKLVEHAQLVGAQAVLGRLSPLFPKGGWDAMDPIDRAMGVDNVETRTKLLGDWMRGLQRARQLAMQAQASSAARDIKRLNLKSQELTVDVDDEVWVLFPNVGKGKSRKLAFRAHGPYVIKRWLQDTKRTAELAHKGEEEDRIVAHVDRIVPKRSLPQRLIDSWKPIKLEMAFEQKAERKAQAQAKVEAKGRKKEMVETREVDDETRKELEKELDDEDYRIQSILADDETVDGDRVFKVRFVGYGPRSDLWYKEVDLRRTAPDMLDAYLAKADAAGGPKRRSMPKAKAKATKKTQAAQVESRTTQDLQLPPGQPRRSMRRALMAR